MAEAHLLKGHQVIGVDNFCTGSPRNFEFLSQLKAGAFSGYQFDVSESWSSHKSVWGDVDRIYHFASPASPPLYQKLALETLRVNSIGTWNALEFAHQCGARVVFASTSEIYGDPLVHPQAETYWGNVNTLGPRSCYDEAKRFGEALIVNFNQKKQTQHGFVRIFNTYGPRMNPLDGRVVIQLLLQALRGEALSVYGDGLQTRSFCYVSDLVEGIIAYADRGLNEPVNLGNDFEFSIMELVEKLRNLFSSKNLRVQHLPLPTDDPKQRRPDLDKARKLLHPWNPKIQLEDGLRLMKEALEKSGFRE